MARHFSVTILLEQYQPLDIDGLADIVAGSFPQIGQIDGVAGLGAGRDAGLLHIDGAHVIVTAAADRLVAGAIAPPVPILRRWDPDSAIAGHKAHMTISCGGSLPGLEGAKAYAAAVHFVAAAIVAVTPASAVFWHHGYALSSAQSFAEAARLLLRGIVPLDNWIGFAPILPRAEKPDKATGMISIGLRHFLGRELELSPRPVGRRRAFAQIASIARQAMAGEIDLADRLQIDTDASADPLTVRSRNYWLRRDLSAFVLVAPDAIVDADTLRPHRRAVA